MAHIQTSRPQSGPERDAVEWSRAALTLIIQGDADKMRSHLGAVAHPGKPVKPVKPEGTPARSMEAQRSGAWRTLGKPVKPVKNVTYVQLNDEMRSPRCVSASLSQWTGAQRVEWSVAHIHIQGSR